MSNDNHFNNQICVVTGAASGIGLAVSEALLEAGATVFMADRDSRSLNAVMDKLGPRGRRAYPRLVDVTHLEQVEAVLEEAVSECGRLDILFNNAGIGATFPIERATLEQWRRVIDVNLWGVIHGVHAALPIMRRQGKGHIVNTASIAGLVPFPFQAMYCATKYAVVGMSESLRFELADDGIAVSVVCPGDVATRIYGTPILGEPVEGVKPPSNAIPAEEAARIILEGVAKREGIIAFPDPARMLWRSFSRKPSVAEGFLLEQARERRHSFLTTGSYY